MQASALSTTQAFVSQTSYCQDRGEITTIYSEFALGDSRKSLRLWTVSRERDYSSSDVIKPFVEDYIPNEQDITSVLETAKQFSLEHNLAMFFGNRNVWYVLIPSGYYVYLVDEAKDKTREIGGDRLLVLRYGSVGLLRDVHLLITSERLGGEPRLLARMHGLISSEKELATSIAERYSVSGPLGIISRTSRSLGQATSRPLTLAHVSSDRGQVRQNNEDCGSIINVGVANDRASDRFTLTGIADGVGGLASGEIASRLAISSAMGEMTWHLIRDEGMDLSPTFSSVFDDASEKIMKVASYSGKSMASTLALAIVKGGKVWTGNAGDTRVYGIKPQEDKISQLTTDHRLQSEGPQSHVITRSLGSREHTPDVSSSFQMQEGDMLVSCSDGLHDLVGEREILESARLKRVPKDICADLTSRANSRGGKDNITVATLLWKGTLAT